MSDTAISLTNASIAPSTDRLAQTFKTMLPYGAKLHDNEAKALAMYSTAHGLDPFNGECYFLVRERKDGSRESMGVYPGIKALRKKSKEQLQTVDPQAFYHIDYDVVDPKEVGLNPAEIAMVLKATLHDSISTGKYIAFAAQLVAAGLKWNDAEAVIGKPPAWTGYGAVRKSELGYIKMTPLDLAKKRAEAAATRQRFDLPFVDEQIAEDVAPEITEIAPASSQAKPRRSEAQIMGELGFSEPPSPGEPHEQENPPVVEGGYSEPEQEETESSGAEYADLDMLAGSDATTAFWHLTKRVNMSKDEAQGVIKENHQNFADAYKAVRNSSWCK